MKPFYFEAKSKEEVNIHIYGVIGSNNTNWGDGTNNTAYALVSLIKKLDQSYQKINVHINSPGGDIGDGLAIFNALKQAKAEINTFNSGLTASMASILMLAGKTHMPKTSVYHLHSASTITFGGIKEHQQQIEALTVFESTLQTAIAERTGMSIEDIQAKWFDGAEHYMTASQASELGFVDVLGDEKAEPPAEAEKLQNMTFEQVMELYASNDSYQPQSRNVFNKLKSFFSNNNINSKNSDMGKPLAFRAKLTILLALIGLQELLLNADGKVEMDLDQAYKINDELEAGKNEIEALKQENIQLREQSEARNAKINELQARLDNTSQMADSTISGDNSTVIEPEKEVVILDDETSARVHALNRANKLY